MFDERNNYISKNNLSSSNFLSSNIIKVNDNKEDLNAKNMIVILNTSVKHAF